MPYHLATPQQPERARCARGLIGRAGKKLNADISTMRDRSSNFAIATLNGSTHPNRHLLPAGWTKRNRLPPGNEKSVGDGAAGILDGVLQPLGIEHGQRLGRRILAIRLKPPSSPFAKAEKGPQSVNDHEKARCRKPSLYTAFRAWPHFQIIELSGHSRRSVLFCCRYVLKQSFQKTGVSGVGFP